MFNDSNKIIKGIFNLAAVFNIKAEPVQII